MLQECMEWVPKPDRRGEIFLKSVLLRERESFDKEHPQHIKRLRHIKEWGESHESYIISQFCVTEVKTMKDQRWPQVFLFLPFEGGLPFWFPWPIECSWLTCWGAWGWVLKSPEDPPVLLKCPLWGASHCVGDPTALTSPCSEEAEVTGKEGPAPAVSHMCWCHRWSAGKPSGHPSSRVMEWVRKRNPDESQTENTALCEPFQRSPVVSGTFAKTPVNTEQEHTFPAKPSPNCWHRQPWA